MTYLVLPKRTAKLFNLYCLSRLPNNQISNCETLYFASPTATAIRYISLHLFAYLKSLRNVCLANQFRPRYLFKFAFAKQPTKQLVSQVHFATSFAAAKFCIPGSVSSSSIFLWLDVVQDHSTFKSKYYCTHHTNVAKWYGVVAP